MYKTRLYLSPFSSCAKSRQSHLSNSYFDIAQNSEFKPVFQVLHIKILGDSSIQNWVWYKWSLETMRYWLEKGFKYAVRSRRIGFIMVSFSSIKAEFSPLLPSNHRYKASRFFYHIIWVSERDVDNQTNVVNNVVTFFFFNSLMNEQYQKKSKIISVFTNF